MIPIKKHKKIDITYNWTKSSFQDIKNEEIVDQISFLMRKLKKHCTL